MYIDKAKELVSKVYRSHYAPINNVNQNVDEEEDDLIAHIYKKRHTVRQDEFELYLDAPRAPRKADPLQWWKVSGDFLVSFREEFNPNFRGLQVHESEYPNLAAMARDYLAVPGMNFSLPFFLEYKC